MMLFTDSASPPDFHSFPGRPHRECFRHDYGEDGPPWWEHNLAPILQGLLIERGLDHHDISIMEVDCTDDLEDGCMTIVGETDTRTLLGSVNDDQLEGEVEGLIADLNHVVAWRTRDQMIVATLKLARPSDTWVTEATLGHSGLVVPTWTDGYLRHAVPAWAVTASTPLVRHLASAGVGPVEALMSACREPAASNEMEQWTKIAGIHVNYSLGRLHTRQTIREFVVSDWSGLELFAAGRELPDSVMGSAVGRRLSELVSFSQRPFLLARLDPVITDVQVVEAQRSLDQPAGTLIRLEAGSETLDDIPHAALAAIGDDRPRVPRSEKPWLRRRMPALPSSRCSRSPRLPFP